MSVDPKPEKTVYVLGAGFSAPAGGPDQAALMSRIVAMRDPDPRVARAQESIQEFLSDAMQLRPDQVPSVSLEDFYTPIDRCLADGIALRGRTTTELESLRSEMEYLISLAIDKAIDEKHANRPGASSYVRDFAEHLVRLSEIRRQKAAGEDYADRAKGYDVLSIVSLNWDILLDKQIYQALSRMDDAQDLDYAPIGVVDYCCYISSLKSNERRIRTGLWALGSRGYNVKLLKLHGSMNWLQCSNCQRLFVSFDEKIVIRNAMNVEMCRHCGKHGVLAMLRGSLVMPTFLKDLSNFQIKLIWQNAAVELMEADRIVFIGYSLPQSDFEFRQLLSRMVRRDSRIEVVLYSDQSPDGSRKYEEECRRYRQFFGARTVTCSDSGVEHFVRGLG